MRLVTMFKWNQASLKWLLIVIIGLLWRDENSNSRGATAARTDPVELQAVHAMMAATGNAWASSIPDVCVKSGRWHGIECALDGEVYHVIGLSSD